MALATRRPLFVTGAPGAGKSSLAKAVAKNLGWAYLATTITSRTRLDDLIARYDAVQRLNDAQANQARPSGDYLVPGVLWWAFRPGLRGRAGDGPRRTQRRQPRCDGVVVLLDEMDKAEPDLPNDLLGPLDRYEIVVPGRGADPAADTVLIVITSNGERRMPPAFLRRCVVLELDDEDPAFFLSVATSHFGLREDSLYADVARRTLQLAASAQAERRRKPSMAEYLDTVRACIAYDERPPSDSGPGSHLWAAIEEAALRKTRPADVAGTGV